MFTKIKTFFLVVGIASVALLAGCDTMKPIVKPGTPVLESSLSQKDREMPPLDKYPVGKCWTFSETPDVRATGKPEVESLLCVKHSQNGRLTFQDGEKPEVTLSEFFSRGSKEGTCFMQFPLTVGHVCHSERKWGHPNGSPILYVETVVVKALEKVMIANKEYVVFTLEARGNWTNLTTGFGMSVTRLLRYAPSLGIFIEEYYNGGVEIRYKKLKE